MQLRRPTTQILAVTYLESAPQRCQRTTAGPTSRLGPEQVDAPLSNPVATVERRNVAVVAVDDIIRRVDAPLDITGMPE